MRKIAILLITSAAIFGLVISGCAKKDAFNAAGKEEEKISYWTCGMHPSVHVSDEEYRKGKKNCPICGMNLIPASGAHQTAQPAAMGAPQNIYYGCGIKEEGHCPHCDEGKADAKCICGGHSVMIEGSAMKCPICGKPLKELTPEEAAKMDKSIVSRVSLKKEQIELAGITLEPAKKYHITKTIRTVGKVAFDPDLAIAQEEFLTVLEMRQKVSKSTDPDVIARAEDIVNRSKVKLRLLGLGEDEIKTIEEARSSQTNLLLPEDKMWIYANIYEQDMAWIKEGQAAKVVAIAYPGEEFSGLIKSISPVLDPNTRSVKVRIEVRNPDKKLKPEMYVDVIIESEYTSPDGSYEILAVPKEAILDTGTRKIIYVQALGFGEYLGKEVNVGPEGMVDIAGKEVRLYPILSGLREGDLVVRKGNFLIDSQSQLTGGMSVLWGGAEEIKSEHKH